MRAKTYQDGLQESYSLLRDYHAFMQSLLVPATSHIETILASALQLKNTEGVRLEPNCDEILQNAFELKRYLKSLAILEEFKRGTIRLSHCSCSLKDLIVKAYAQIHAMFKARKQTFKFSGVDAKKDHLIAAELLEFVFEILLSHASRLSSAGDIYGDLQERETGKLQFELRYRGRMLVSERITSNPLYHLETAVCRLVTNLHGGEFEIGPDPQTWEDEIKIAMSLDTREQIQSTELEGMDSLFFTPFL